MDAILRVQKEKSMNLDVIVNHKVGVKANIVRLLSVSVFRNLKNYYYSDLLYSRLLIMA